MRLRNTRICEPDDVYDVIILGSGAGGLSAAVVAAAGGVSVCVLEKADVFGGTTALSGGVLWIPGNDVNARQGVADNVDDAREYLKAMAGNFYDVERVDAFLNSGPEMVSWFENETEVAFEPQPEFPDYHPELPGAVAGGRSIVAAPFDARKLGADMTRLRPPLREITFVGMMFNASAEVKHFFAARRSLRSALYVFRRLLTHGYEMLRFRRAIRLTNGNALVARLFASAAARGVAIHTSASCVGLLEADGEVIGVVAEINGRRCEISARRGVVLATGGFPQDVARIREVFPHGDRHRSPAPKENTGDGLRMATVLGGQAEDRFPNLAAWIPVSLVSRKNGEVGRFPHLVDRYKPGIIAINRNGVRFTNEAQSYHDFGKAMLKDAGGDAPFAWLLCDSRAISKYGLGYVKPFPVPHGQHVRSGYLRKASTLTELARKIEVPGDALERTVADYNRFARQGEDPAFGKGSTQYNRFLGDADHPVDPCNAPLETPPFFAVRVVMGDLGTFGGLKTDSKGAVLRSDGSVIRGLFAVGNDMASIMGGEYPGGGITLGPAMTFGYIIGRELTAATQSRKPAGGMN